METKENKDLIEVDRVEHESYLLSLVKEKLGVLFTSLSISFNNNLRVVVENGELTCNERYMEIAGEKYYFWFVKDLKSKMYISNANKHNIFQSWEYISKNGVKLVSFLSLHNPGFVFVFSTDIEEARKHEETYYKIFSDKERRWDSFVENLNNFVQGINKNLSSRGFYSLIVAPATYINDCYVLISYHENKFVLHTKEHVLLVKRDEIINFEKKNIVVLFNQCNDREEEMFHDFFSKISPAYGWEKVQIEKWVNLWLLDY